MIRPMPSQVEVALGTDRMSLLAVNASLHCLHGCFLRVDLALTCCYCFAARLDALLGSIAVQERLQCSKARHCRLHQNGRTRDSTGTLSIHLCNSLHRATLQ